MASVSHIFIGNKDFEMMSSVCQVVFSLHALQRTDILQTFGETNSRKMCKLWNEKGKARKDTEEGGEVKGGSTMSIS